MPKRIAEAVKSAIVPRHLDGLTNIQIARELRVDPASVARILAAQGLKSRRSTSKPSPEDAILALHREGFANIEIGEKLGVDRKAVGQILARNGLRSARTRQRIVMVDEINAQCTKCSRMLPREDLPWGRVTKDPYQLSYCRQCLTAQVVANTRKSVAQYLKHRERAIKARAAEAGVPYMLPPGHLHDLYVEQGGKCFYTDEQMQIYFGTQKSGSRRDSLSVDKIVPGRGYIAGNVVLCIARANSVKHDCTLGEIRAWMPGWYARIEARFRLWEREGIPVTVVPGWEDIDSGTASPNSHTCRPPVHTRGCDCSRCCPASPHEPDCSILPPDCDCPPEDPDDDPGAPEHLDGCPAWEHEQAIDGWLNAPYPHQN